jgi:hypothetical protein
VKAAVTSLQLVASNVLLYEKGDWHDPAGTA